jgi:hypothetical protein
VTDWALGTFNQGLDALSTTVAKADKLLHNFVTCQLSVSAVRTNISDFSYPYGWHKFLGGIDL